MAGDLPPPPEPIDELGETSLVDLVDHVLNKGVVLTGEATIAIANIDLIYLGLNVVLGSAQTVRDSGRGNRELGIGNSGTGPAPAAESPHPDPLPEGEVIPNSQLPIPNSQLPQPNLSPDNVDQGLAKLVLALIEFLRRVLERQAVRRMDGGDLSEQDVERMGVTLMRLEEKVLEMAQQFGLRPEDLNLDLGPLGKLL